MKNIAIVCSILSAIMIPVCLWGSNLSLECNLKGVSIFFACLTLIATVQTVVIGAATLIIFYSKPNS